MSFLRDFNFWKESAGRLGLDLEGLGRRGRLGFVDGLGVGGSGTGAGGGEGGGAAAAATASLPVRTAAGATGAVPGRGPPVARPTPTLTSAGVEARGGLAGGQGPAGGQQEKWKRSLPSLAVADVSKTLHAALDELLAKNKKVVLVIDQLDFLLAATSDGNGPSVSSALKDLLLDLREVSCPIVLYGGLHMSGKEANDYDDNTRNHMLRFSHCLRMTR